MLGRAIAFVAIAALTVYLILRFATPAVLPNPAPDSSPNSAANSETVSPPVLSPQPSLSTDPIAPPRTEERRQQEQTEARRAPFYVLLRQNFASIAAVRPAADDPATLEIYANIDDPRVSMEIVRLAMVPNGSKYGFERVRFYLPNAPGSVDRYRLDAEATVDKQGVWNTFRL
jgi:hypothetical protein